MNVFLDWWKERNSRPGFYGEASVAGITVIVNKGVYSPDPKCTHATTMLLGLLPEPKGLRVLDLGTGTGIVAIWCAKKGADRVLAVDIQPEAVENAQQNFEALACVPVCSAKFSDLFEEVEGEFDVIIANLPIMDPEWIDLHKIACETNQRFLDQLPKYLSPQGKAYISSTSWGDVETLKKMIAESGFQMNVHEEEASNAVWYVFELSYK